MNTKVSDIMVESVVTSHRHQTIGHIKKIMKKNKIHSLPIVDSENQLEGIVTSHDFADDISEDTQVGHIMTKKVFTIPKYSGVHVAARVMRNHYIHHLVVTHEKKVAGVLSSFDLLKLVEKHRFVVKNAPSASGKGKGRQ